MKTYSFNAYAQIGDVEVCLDVDYEVEPGLRATRVDPAWPAEVINLTWRAYRTDNNADVEMMPWQIAALMPDDDELISHANGRDLTMRMEAAE